MTRTTRKTPYRINDLRTLYTPGSIAVIGASPRASSFGGRTVANLADFDGQLFLINAKYPEINGTICYPSIAALPQVPDLVVITTPSGSVEAIVEDCIAAGVPAAIIYASGFAETSLPDDVARQARLARRAQDSGLRLLGPNCVGLLNYVNGARITFAGIPEGRHKGGPAIGLISQSGALGFALVQAMDRGVAFSHVLSAGNSLDVDVADWVAVLAEDPECSAIACAFEGLADPRRFLKAAELAWDNNKPLVVYKMATGEEGSAAAMSHTGSLAGSQILWNALFEQAGAVVVEDFDALIETAYFFAKTAAPKASGVALLSGSGGAAIMGADFAEDLGVPMPQPTDSVVATLKANIPSFVPARNPCDVTAQVINDMDSLLTCADAMLGDPNYGALVFGYTYAYETATARQPHLSKLAAKHGKPIILVWLTQALEGPGTIEAERDPNLIVFRSMRRCFGVLKSWTRRNARRGQSDGVFAAVPQSGRDRGAARLAAAKTRALGERDAKALLADYGIAVPNEILVTDTEGAAQAAVSIGGSLAMKVDSPDILHKSDVGGVELNVTGPEAAQAAFASIIERCQSAYPEAQIDGVLVQEMIPPGLEILVGFRNVDGFGAALTVGLGGVLTEIMRDSATALAPVTENQAEAMLRSLKGAALFDGYRGAEPVAMRDLARAVSAISQLAVDHGDRIVEFDVNPLICLPKRIVAVDGMAVLALNNTAINPG